MVSGLAVFSALLFGAALYLLRRLAARPMPSHRWLLVGVVYLLLALITATTLWRGLWEGYRGDSFHTLSMSGQAGLVLLSMVVAVVLVSLVAAKTERLYGAGRVWRLPAFLGVTFVDGLANLMLFALFLWLSPQFYYAYYLTLFDDLAWQWVVKAPPAPGAVLGLLTMAPEGSLADHGLGLLGRALVLLALTAPALRAASALAQRSRIAEPAAVALLGTGSCLLAAAVLAGI